MQVESSAINLKKALNDLAIATFPAFASAPPVIIGGSAWFVELIVCDAVVKLDCARVEVVEVVNKSEL